MADIAYDLSAHGCRVVAEYRDGPDALITLYVHDVKVREFAYPAYRIWNIAAHFESDLVPDLLEAYPSGVPRD